MEAFEAKLLPLRNGDLDPTIYMEALIDATAAFEVYKTKLNDSKLDQSWFLPTLQQREAWASSLLEGTQATIDDILVDQVNPSEKDKNMSEVRNYICAAQEGSAYLRRHLCSADFLKRIHRILMSGNVRRNKLTIPGEFRTGQNYLSYQKTVQYIPPLAENIDVLIDNFTDYFNDTEDNMRPLVRAAIMHAQFETIHPFNDGNGRVGRILIPLFLYKHNQLSQPYFFISEALERDKYKYFDLLNGIREKNDWNAWIDFFLRAVCQQCEKYISMVDQINALYENDLERAKSVIKSSKVVDLINLLYKYPVINASMVTEYTEIPAATATRYLSLLVEHRILYSDNKSRNRTYFYYNLLGILR